MEKFRKRKKKGTYVRQDKTWKRKRGEFKQENIKGQRIYHNQKQTHFVLLFSQITFSFSLCLACHSDNSHLNPFFFFKDILKQIYLLFLFYQIIVGDRELEMRFYLIAVKHHFFFLRENWKWILLFFFDPPSFYLSISLFFVVWLWMKVTPPGGNIMFHFCLNIVSAYF